MKFSDLLLEGKPIPPQAPQVKPAGGASPTSDKTVPEAVPAFDEPVGTIPNEDPTNDPLNVDNKSEVDMTSKLNKWLQSKGKTNTSAEDLLNGIDAGSFVSLSDALDSNNDREVISTLKKMKEYEEKKGLIGRSHEEINEEFGDFGKFTATKSKPTKKPTQGETLNNAKELERKLSTDPNMQVSIKGKDNTSIEAELEDIAIDTTNPESTLVAVKSKTNPNDVDMVPLDAVSMMEGFSNIIEKEILREYKITKGLHGKRINISNEEHSILRRVQNSVFLKEQDLSDRELKIAQDLNKKGVIKRVKINDTIGYKIIKE